MKRYDIRKLYVSRVFLKIYLDVKYIFVFFFLSTLIFNFKNTKNPSHSIFYCYFKIKLYYMLLRLSIFAYSICIYIIIFFHKSRWLVIISSIIERFLESNVAFKQGISPAAKKFPVSRWHGTPGPSRAYHFALLFPLSVVPPALTRPLHPIDPL